MKSQVVQEETPEFHKSVEESVKYPPTHFSVHLLAMIMYLAADNLHAHEKLWNCRDQIPDTGSHNQFVP